MSRRKYTDQEFMEAVASCFSIRETLLRLGLKAAGGNYQSFHNLVRELDLNIGHFHDRKVTPHNKGKKTGPRTEIGFFLSNAKPIQSYKLKNRLLKEGYFVRICSSCKNTEWMGHLIPLELDHIDGNPKNNTLSNLRLLCPNCHAFTPTYRGKNKKTS